MIAGKSKALTKMFFHKSKNFIVNRKVTVETGGKSRTKKQIASLDLDNAFIASDGIEYGFGNKIPLWMFGLLY